MSVVIDDRVWQRIVRDLRKLPKMHAKVGVLASKGGNAQHSSGITLIELMAIHEFGSPAAGIPERKPIRSAFKKNDPELRKLTVRLAKAIINNTMSQEQALEVLGAWGATQIKNNIAQGAHLKPANAPATVAAKGSTRPLVDTGRLLGSINHEVVKK